MNGRRKSDSECKNYVGERSGSVVCIRQRREERLYKASSGHLSPRLVVVLTLQCECGKTWDARTSTTRKMCPRCAKKHSGRGAVGFAIAASHERARRARLADAREAQQASDRKPLDHPTKPPGVRPCAATQSSTPTATA